MDAEKMKSITVLIANRPYPLKIKEKDEKRIKDIVKEINDKINTFQLTYSQKDKQDCLAMALLTYAVDLHKNRESTESSNMVQHLNQIEAMVDSALS
ncbi:MAG: cell division protein ZapA [Bacteroidia bacterium]|nr:cell division protein ZapA [Bacteroidia bacterium]